jgi:hypothetical protein
MKNKECRELLIYEYGELCFLNGIIRLENPLTLHHIKRVSNKGRTNCHNGSLLARIEHDAYHILEKEEEKKAKRIREYLKYYKETRDELARYQAGLEVANEIERLGYVPRLTRDKIYRLKREVL